MYCLQGAAKVSILMIGQQAIMDAYLCLLHLTAGILVGEYCDLHNLFVFCSLICNICYKLKHDQVGFQFFFVQEFVPLWSVFGYIFFNVQFPSGQSLNALF